MDCTNARLLLNYVRTGELDSADRAALDRHLTACPECATSAQSENVLDDALETAMLRVPVPARLKARILQHLARQRGPRIWRGAAAAALILAVGFGAYLALVGGPEEFDLRQYTEEVSIQPGTPREVVEAKFANDHGISMKAPRDFNYNLLESWDVAQVQGRRVPKLTFLARTELGAIAYVYVMPTRQFKLPANLEEEAAKKGGWLNEIIPASKHTIQIRRYVEIPDFFYVIIYTSASLDPFVFQGI